MPEIDSIFMQKLNVDICYFDRKRAEENGRLYFTNGAGVGALQIGSASLTPPMQQQQRL